ncbi:hypothetical protein SSBR45G_62190 [Bradyrhizobium sp. SSBR45G]|uniref:hypothetical protein n=1 Tax=unclassified Bradyrhizobium TaxID=2631580 RepID=UPI0023429F92|nr:MULTISPECIES: hypothetical protein [unclassified Bradyrhizobium]GLH81310.1 hypothetical protein SSBR45G_62190 [Bradyrhizobium sp. SSBR45G]GLH88788.1 hypothetical protein SSBR45R_62490 [Bradyrhizobium sp. SSBR45R]
MAKSVATDVRIARDDAGQGGKMIVFALAIGATRQVCQLETSFGTRNQAFAYLQRNRTAFEQRARELFARGEVTDGIIHLTMI